MKSKENTVTILFSAIMILHGAYLLIASYFMMNGGATLSDCDFSGMWDGGEGGVVCKNQALLWYATLGFLELVNGATLKFLMSVMKKSFNRPNPTPEQTMILKIIPISFLAVFVIFWVTIGLLYGITPFPSISF